MSQKREMDMLHGPLMGKLIRFALPIAASGLLQQLFAQLGAVGFESGKRPVVTGASSMFRTLECRHRTACYEEQSGKQRQYESSGFHCFFMISAAKVQLFLHSASAASWKSSWNKKLRKAV